MGQLGKRTKTVSFYYNSAAAWFLLLCASGSFASYMLLYAASFPLDSGTSVQQREWARGGGGSHNDEGERAVVVPMVRRHGVAW